MTTLTTPGPKGPGFPVRVATWIGPRPLRQFSLLLGVLLLFWFLGTNTVTTMERSGLTPGFAFLSQKANFEIGESVIAYAAGYSYGRALLAGLANTVKVAFFGCILATLLGVALGILRLGGNPVLASLIRAYVEVLRGTPLLLQLFLWTGLFQSLPAPRNALTIDDLAFLSNRGVFIPSIGLSGLSAMIWVPLLLVIAFATAGLARRIFFGQELFVTKCTVVTAAAIAAACATLAFAGYQPSLEFPVRGGFNIRGGWSLSPEFAALLTGLTINASATISEIVRSGIQSVRSGQWEAAKAVGLRPGQIIRLVILPQAFRVITPLLTSSYLDLTKNSSLAVAIGFPDLVSVANTTANTTGQTLEAVGLIMALYLFLNLTVSALMNIYNRRVVMKGEYRR